MRIVCSEFPDWPEIPLEKVRWSEQVERWALSSAEIGIMPLFDDDWSRGKCGFKLLQYMSHGLPAVASRIGVTPEILLHGIHGFVAEDQRSWISALEALLDNPTQASIMGEQGRAHVRARFGRDAIVSRTSHLLKDLVRRRARRSERSDNELGGKSWARSFSWS